MKKLKKAKPMKSSLGHLGKDSLVKLKNQQNKISEVFEAVTESAKKETLEEVIARAAVEKIELKTEVRVLRETLSHVILELGKR